MTPGQRRAIKELERLHEANPDEFVIIGSPQLINGRLKATISLRLGPMEVKEGGLDLRDREEFVLIIRPDFPFEKPLLYVMHYRFAGFPHVNWGRQICLFQSAIEWNPPDGLYGFFERLGTWLYRAAMNNMDPIEGPLHPPFYTPDWSQLPFVIRANTPVEAGESWFGLAELKKYPNRIELVRWNDLSGDWDENLHLSLAVVLPKDLPVEFPESGKDFLEELVKQGIDKQRILRNLRISAILTPENEPAFLVLAMPMRRSPDGRLKHHVAVWVVDPENAKRLREASPGVYDTEKIKAIKDELNDIIYRIFELTPIKWCPVMEDRSEIINRRDIGSPVAWFEGKKVLILGCGALGSWMAEIVARANPIILHLVDNSMVKPGLLARQNYQLADIGLNKAAALSKRIKTIIKGESVQYFRLEALSFIKEDLERFNNYDIVLECTAATIFQMKLERDWRNFRGNTPPFISMVIDAKAQRSLCVVLGRNSEGGPWDAYIQLKNRLCLDGDHKDIISAFYSERALMNLFQPEPGCSDLTFSGSTADILGLASTALNLSVNRTADNIPVGMAFSAHGREGKPGGLDIIKLPNAKETMVDQYRVRINVNIFRVTRAWVQQNNRLRSPRHETGGLLWGLWDDAVNVIWILDASGPPPDSLHDPGHFVCGIKGTVAEHMRRHEISYGTCGFLGFWHTHPDMPSKQSFMDIGGMAELVSRIGQNQKRAIMLIFGRRRRRSTAGIYIYESQSLQGLEWITIGEGQIGLETAVV
jgi:hypothetical protein